MTSPTPPVPKAAAEAAPSDEDVVARVLAGDRSLYELLMRRHNQRLFRAVRAVLRDPSEAEDVLQDVYLAAFRSLADFDGRARFSTWLTRIAVNKAIDRRRQRMRLVVPAEPRDEAAETEAAFGSSLDREDPERRSARCEFAHLLEDAIDALPEAFRIVFVLREIDGMSTHETAASLDLEINTVKTRLHRARSLLRKRLANDFGAEALRAFPFGAERCDRLVAAVLAELATQEQSASEQSPA